MALEPQEAAVLKAQVLFQNESRRIQTCDEQFIAQFQAAKAKRLAFALHPLLQTVPPAAPAYRTLEDLLGNLSAMQSVLKQPRDTVFEIHDLLETYHMWAENRFIDNVVQLGDSVISGASDGPIALFNRTWVENLSTDELQRLVGEDTRTRHARERLDKQIQRLDAAITHSETIVPATNNVQHPNRLRANRARINLPKTVNTKSIQSELTIQRGHLGAMSFGPHISLDVTGNTGTIHVPRSFASSTSALRQTATAAPPKADAMRLSGSEANGFDDADSDDAGSNDADSDDADPGNADPDEADPNNKTAPEHSKVQVPPTLRQSTTTLTQRANDNPAQESVFARSVRELKDHLASPRLTHPSPDFDKQTPPLHGRPARNR